MDTSHELSEQDSTMSGSDQPMNDEAENSTESVEESVIELDGAEAAIPEGSARFVVKRAGIETDISFTFTCPAVIGRFDPSVGPVDIDLGNLDEGVYVSRKHARIVRDESGYRIQDLGSSNGTYILRGGDFKKVEDGELADGDEVALGNARFIFHSS